MRRWFGSPASALLSPSSFSTSFQFFNLHIFILVICLFWIRIQIGSKSWIRIQNLSVKTNPNKTVLVLLLFIFSLNLIKNGQEALSGEMFTKEPESIIHPLIMNQNAFSHHLIFHGRTIIQSYNLWLMLGVDSVRLICHIQIFILFGNLNLLRRM